MHYFSRNDIILTERCVNEMFSDEAYKKLCSSPLYKKFILYCIIGASCFALVGILFILTLYITRNFNIFVRALPVITGIALLCVPAGFIFNGLHKPFLCTYGTLTSKKGNFAEIEVDDKAVRGTSFEHFLKNVSLTDYSVGDTVLIYASDKKMGRPLFFKVK